MTSFQVVSVREKRFMRCQSSMARKPKRLALLLTILWITVNNCFVFGFKQINQNNEDDDISGLLNDSKFGDRISPRHRSSSVTSVFSARSSNLGFLDDRLRLNSKSKINNKNNQLSALNNNSIKNKKNNNQDEDVDDDEEDNLTVTENLKQKTVGLSRKSDEILRFLSDDDDDEGEVTESERPPSNFEAHRLEMSTEFFVVPSSAASSIVRSTTIRPGGVIIATKNLINKNNVLFRNNTVQPAIISAKTGGLRKEPWVVPVLVLAAISMVMMVAFEIFVICKAWSSTPSRRHLFLGQMLLLGLFACAGLAAVLTVSPTTLTCATVRFGAGVSLALVFASLLVKCVFLISLNSGVYLPAPYQGLLLLFAVLIQVAVGAQWLITSPPGVDNFPIQSRNFTGAISSRYSLYLTPNEQAAVLTPTIPLCKTPFPELLLSLIYVVFLILFVAVLAIKSRRIRDNYREATYIGLAIGGTIPIWLGWTLCGLVVADRHRDSCLAFGLVATSATVFLVMFMPKSRQLAALGKEGFYVEDREEQFSSLSRAGSGYSPSFFHFKPIKYGVMGQKMISTINTTENGNSKNQAVASLGGGMLNLYI